MNLDPGTRRPSPRPQPQPILPEPARQATPARHAAPAGETAVARQFASTGDTAPARHAATVASESVQPTLPPSLPFNVPASERLVLTLPADYKLARRRRPARRLGIGLLAACVLATPAATALLGGGAAGAQAKKYDIAPALHALKAHQVTVTARSTATAAATTAAKISFVGASDAGGGNTRAKHVTMPAQAAVGETALLFFARTTTSSWSGPTGLTGWTQVANYAPNTLRTTVWEKTLTAADLGKTVDFTATGYTHASASIVVYSGLDATAPVRATAQAADRAVRSHVTPKLAAESGDWVLSYWADRSGSQRTWTAPSSVGVRVTSPDVAGTALTVQALIADSTAPMSASTSYGAATATTDASTSYGAAWSIALRAAQIEAEAPVQTPTPTPTPTTSTPAPSPTTSTPAPSPTTSTPAPAPAPTGSSCVSNPMGIPSSGAIVGSSAGGTQSMSGLEGEVGRLAEHRTYWSADQVASAVSAAASDLAAGRLPWISFKTPYAWADMAAGKGDTWATDIASRLAALNGPVWVAFWHEPENDTASEGSMADWTAMQAHLAPIVHRVAGNVAYTMILMGWNSMFGPAEDQLVNNWPGDGKIDVIGLDLYNSYGAKSGAGQLDFMKYFDKISAFATAHHSHWALGETGYTSAAQQNYPTYLQDFYAGLVKDGGIAMSYFDSSYNSIADWTLDDPQRVSAYKEVLGKTARLC